MTCIVGIIKGDKTYIGGDSAGSNNYFVNKRKDPKVFKKGEFVIGCTTSYRMIQLLMYSFKPPKVRDKELHEYMCTDFVDEVRKCFKKGGYAKKYLDGDEKGGVFLIGYKGRLFRIDSDFQVEEPMDKYSACGCGDTYAVGSLESTKHLNVKERIKEALRVASKHSPGVEPPFLIMKSK